MSLGAFNKNALWPGSEQYTPKTLEMICLDNLMWQLEESLWRKDIFISLSNYHAYISLMTKYVTHHLK